MEPSGGPRTGSDWSGSAFTVQVRRSGRLALVDRGSPDDVPPDLVRIAAAMWQADLGECSFHWRAPRTGRLCRVTTTVRREITFDYVELVGDPVGELPAGLSLRELEILTMLVAGLGNAEIASDLGITQRTAATHVTNVLHKLGVATRTAAATWALDTGLLCVPLPGSPAHYDRLSVGRLVAAAATPAHLVPTPRPPRPGRSRRDLVVGAALPMTGKGDDDGREMVNGLRLAIEEINEAGGIRGRRVRASVTDVDVTSAQSVRSAFDALLTGGVDVLTSGYLAAQDLGHEIAASAGVPYLHAATSGAVEQMVRDDIRRFGRVFQMCASDTEYAPRFVSFMTSVREQPGWPGASDRLVILAKRWRGVDFGVDRARLAAQEQGWRVDVVPVGGPEDGDGWSRAVTTALREPAAAVMIGSYFVDDAVQSVLAIRATGSPSLVYSTYAPSVPTFRARLGPLAEGVVWATMTGTYSDRIGREFARRYGHRFGVAPGRSHAGIAYDRMQRISLAWRQCGDATDAEDIAAHVRSQPYRGVNGTYNFDTPGQAARGIEDQGDPSLAQPQLIYQIQDGRQVIIGGGPFRTGDFRVPGYAALR